MVGGADARNGESLSLEIGELFDARGNDELIREAVRTAENDVGSRPFEIGLDRAHDAALADRDFAGHERGGAHGCPADVNQFDVEAVLFEKTRVERNPDVDLARTDGRNGYPELFGLVFGGDRRHHCSERGKAKDEPQEGSSFHRHPYLAILWLKESFC